MDAQTHWEKVYGTKAQDAVSWYRPHLERSLELIEHAAHGPLASIIDVGGGESTLVDDLVARGYGNITVLDISQTAIDVTKKRLGPPQKISIGLSAISRARNWSLVLTTCGMIAPCSIFCLHQRHVWLMSAKWPTR